MKNKRLHLYFLVFILVFAGILLTTYQHRSLRMPFSQKNQAPIWEIEAKISFFAKKNVPIKSFFYVPNKLENFIKINESFATSDYGVVVNTENDNRIAILSKRDAKGQQILYYHLTICKTSNKKINKKNNTYIMEPTIGDTQYTDAKAIAANAIISSIQKQSADIQTLTSELLKKLSDKDNHNSYILLKGDTAPETIANVAAVVLSMANIPARVLHCLNLSGNKNDNDEMANSNLKFESLVAVHDGTKWIYLNPKNSATGLGKNLIVWYNGPESLFKVEGGKDPNVKLNIAKKLVSSLDLSKKTGTIQDSKLMDYSLFTLPLEAQKQYRVLIMVPIGVIIILIFRSFIGIKTFGTFMPVLIALAFRETHILWGCSLFIMIVSLGLLIRAYLNNLQLLMVPKLAVILTTVVIMMVVISIFSHKLGFESGLSISLFPMVILTMTIERASILWEERGASETIVTTAGSLFTASVACIAMMNQWLTFLCFTFPGFLLIIIAIMLLFGIYRGYKISELIRFREFLKKYK